MDLRGLIKARKASVKAGDWKQGEIPRAQWPSRRAKSKAYKFGPNYSWRLISFIACESECRVRILLNEHKQIFRATLGVVDHGETIILCDYEFHASEPGWHCHARCDDISMIDASANRFGSLRIPKYGSHHRRSEFKFARSELSRVSAFNCAVDFFGIDKREDSL